VNGDVRTSLIVAADENDLIGRANGDLPWHLPKDFQRFRRLTTGHVMVMGRLTHDSIMARNGWPLPGRFTVVVTRQTGLPAIPGVLYQPDVAAALAMAQSIENFANRFEVFVLGGAQIYEQALPGVDTVYLTRVHTEAVGDVYLPDGWLDAFTLVEADKNDEDNLPVTYCRYERGA
jgi:dihydrofolate reductase